MMAQFVLKIEKLSHIIGKAGSGSWGLLVVSDCEKLPPKTLSRVGMGRERDRGYAGEYPSSENETESSTETGYYS